MLIVPHSSHSVSNIYWNRNLSRSKILFPELDELYIRKWVFGKNFFIIAIFLNEGDSSTMETKMVVSVECDNLLLFNSTSVNAQKRFWI